MSEINNKDKSKEAQTSEANQVKNDNESSQNQIDSKNESEQIQEESEDDDEQDEDEYVVEEILEHKQNKKGKQYLIKWLNYGHDDNTWEPEENIVDKNLLQQYWEKVENNKAKGKNTTDKKPAPTNKRKTREEEPRSPPVELILDQSYPPKSLEDWENEVDEVITLEKVTGNKVLVYLRWKNDVYTSHSVEEAHQKLPQKMLKFYQEHLDFDFE